MAGVGFLWVFFFFLIVVFTSVVAVVRSSSVLSERFLEAVDGFLGVSSSALPPKLVATAVVVVVAAVGVLPRSEKGCLAVTPSSTEHACFWKTGLSWFSTRIPFSAAGADGGTDVDRNIRAIAADALELVGAISVAGDGAPGWLFIVPKRFYGDVVLFKHEANNDNPTRPQDRRFIGLIFNDLTTRIVSVKTVQL